MTATITHTPRTIPTRGDPKFFWGHLQEFQQDILSFLLDVPRRDGPVVAIKLAAATQYILTESDYVLHVLQTNQKNYIKEQRLMGFSRTALQGTDNLFTSDGAFWLRERRIMQPAFHRHVVAKFGTTIAEEAQRFVTRWLAQGTGASTNIEEGMMNLTMQIIGRTMFNVDMEKGKYQDLHHAFTFIGDHIVARSFNIFHPPLWMPVAGNPKFKHSAKIVLETVTDILKQRATSNEPQGDLLDLLLEAKDEAGNQLNREQLIDEMMGIVFAGHETTALTLSWLSYLLATHPDIQQAVQVEVDTVLDGRAITSEDLPNLPMVRAAVMEALRLYPAAWTTTRQSVGEDTIDGYTIPADALILINIYGLHHSPDYWDAPEEFRPERFLDGTSYAKGAYLPFGAGPRKCIGEPLAMMEAQLILATLVQQASIALDPAHHATPYPRFTLRAKDGVWLKLTPR